MLVAAQGSGYKQARVPAKAVLNAIFGGLLLMVGNHSLSESLVYYFRMEDQVPENHLVPVGAADRKRRSRRSELGELEASFHDG